MLSAGESQQRCVASPKPTGKAGPCWKEMRMGHGPLLWTPVPSCPQSTQSWRQRLFFLRLSRSSQCPEAPLPRAPQPQTWANAIFSVSSGLPVFSHLHNEIVSSPPTSQKCLKINCAKKETICFENRKGVKSNTRLQYERAPLSPLFPMAQGTNRPLSSHTVITQGP